MEKYSSSPQLFKKETWKLKPDVEDRRWVFDNFAKYAKKFTDFSEDAQVPIIPMFQGTAENTSMKIAQTGFSTVATLDDGFYARGIYFTSSINYASYYSTIAMKGKGPYVCIMMAFVSPGNPYPVIEGPIDKNTLKGKAGVINPGYQSHYISVMAPGSSQPGWPCVKGDKLVADELVIFQDAQAMPKYILMVER